MKRKRNNMKKVRKQVGGLAMGTLGAAVGAQALGAAGAGMGGSAQAITGHGQAGLLGASKFAPAAGSVIGAGMVVGMAHDMIPKQKKSKRKKYV